MRPHAIERQAQEAIDVVRTVQSAVASGQAADQALNALFRSRRQYGSRDRRLFAGLVFAWFRWKGWVEHLPDLPQALAAAAWLDDIGNADLLHRWWSALAPIARPSSIPEQGRILSELSAGRIHPALQSLVPAWFEDEWDAAESRASLADFVESIQRRPPLWLRSRAGSLDTVLAALHRADVPAEADARLPGLIRVDDAPSRDVLAPLLHRHAEIQDIASQCVGLLCAPKPGEHCWDLCAGAGGKSLHLLDQLKESGHVLCTDVRAEALDELTHRAGKAGFRNWTARLIPTEPSDWKIESTFDAILLDAPCTGTGTWGRAPDARWRSSQEECRAQAARQLHLLRQALRHLKPGGRLLYSVCSLTRSETQGVLAALAHEAAFHVNPRHHPLTHTTSDSCRILPIDGPGIGMWCVEIEQ